VRFGLGYFFWDSAVNSVFLWLESWEMAARAGAGCRTWAWAG
jgi:hypothetical protein